MKKIVIEQSSKAFYSNHSGLALVGNLINGYTSLCDRLLHRSHVFNIKGRSYRLRELERAAATQ